MKKHGLFVLGQVICLSTFLGIYPGSSFALNSVSKTSGIFRFKSSNRFTTKSDNPDSVYIMVEKMPVYPGGEQALMEYIAKNTRYPKKERKKGIQGRVMVQFVVNAEGLVESVKVARGIAGGEELEKEAIRVVQNMPVWQPGFQNGKAVSVQFLIPINFILR